jgi:hypothetical protein
MPGSSPSKAVAKKPTKAVGKKPTKAVGKKPTGKTVGKTASALAKKKTQGGQKKPKKTEEQKAAKNAEKKNKAAKNRKEEEEEEEKEKEAGDSATMVPAIEGMSLKEKMAMLRRSLSGKPNASQAEVSKAVDECSFSLDGWRKIRGRFETALENCGDPSIEEDVRSSANKNKQKRANWIAWIVDPSWQDRFMRMRSVMSKTITVERKEEAESEVEILRRMSQGELDTLIECGAIQVQSHPANPKIKRYLDLYRYSKTTTAKKQKEMHTTSSKAIENQEALEGFSAAWNKRMDSDASAFQLFDDALALQDDHDEEGEEDDKASQKKGGRDPKGQGKGKKVPTVASLGQKLRKAAMLLMETNMEVGAVSWPKNAAGKSMATKAKALLDKSQDLQKSILAQCKDPARTLETLQKKVKEAEEMYGELTGIQHAAKSVA